VRINGQNFDGTGTMAITAKIKAAGAGGHVRGYIIGSSRLAFSVDRANRKICFYSGSLMVTMVCSDINSLQLNTWQQVAVVQDVSNQEVTFYINGVKTQRKVKLSPLADRNFAIGNYPSSSGTVRPFAGFIDDVRVYNRVLSATELQALSAGTDPTPTPSPSQFDFTVTNAGNRSVTAGTAITNAITATLTGGTVQPVSFSTAGLPAGATAAFSTTQCAPTCFMNMNITTSASMPSSVSTVTVTGKGGNLIRTTQFALNVTQSPTPTQPPTPTAPTPTPAPTSGDSGVSDAPTSPANKRLLVVAKDGSGTYSTIQAAADASQPGDTIQVKNGTYREYVQITRNGTRTLPITFIAYPGHTPRLTGAAGFRLSARWVIIDGFEVTGVENGINITGIYGPSAGNSTIRNNWIHDNGFQGIFLSSAPDVLIENNTLERNGLGPGQCTKESWGGLDYTHCHGIYTGNTTWCVADMSGVTIRRNTFRGNSGSGWQNYTNPKCSTRSKNFLVENNVLIDNAIGFYAWNLDNSVIRNNTVVQLSYAKIPSSNAAEMLSLNVAYGNLVANNLFYTTTNPSTANLWIVHSWNRNSNQQTFRNNAWYVHSGARWLWSGAAAPGTFLDTYRELTGDGGAVLRRVESPTVDAAQFRNLLGRDYHLTENSSARDAGLATACPAADKDGTPRPQGTRCDIGAYEFK
jgi:parallel beta-helix repeat protein